MNKNILQGQKLRELTDAGYNKGWLDAWQKAQDHTQEAMMTVFFQWIHTFAEAHKEKYPDLEQAILEDMKRAWKDKEQADKVKKEEEKNKPDIITIGG